MKEDICLPFCLFVIFSMQVAHVTFDKLTAWGMPEKARMTALQFPAFHTFSSGKIKTKNRLNDTFPDSWLSN
jgi:hypothetical protein